MTRPHARARADALQRELDRSKAELAKTKAELAASEAEKARLRDEADRAPPTSAAVRARAARRRPDPVAVWGLSIGVAIAIGVAVFALTGRKERRDPDCTLVSEPSGARVSQACGAPTVSDKPIGVTPLTRGTLGVGEGQQLRAAVRAAARWLRGPRRSRVRAARTRSPSCVRWCPGRRIIVRCIGTTRSRRADA